MAETMALSVIASDPERSLAFIQNMGERIVMGMKGVKSKSLATVVAIQMLSEGLPPVAFEQKYHVYDEGGFGLRAEWIHAEMLRRGWKVTWLNTGEDGKRAAVRLENGSQSHDIEFTIEMAHRKGLGKSDGKKFKAGSAWDKDPAQMLRSKLWGRAATMFEPSIGAGMQEDAEYIGGEIIDASFQVESEPQKKKRGRPKGSTKGSRQSTTQDDQPSSGSDAPTEQDTEATATESGTDAASESQGGDTARAVDPAVAEANAEAAAATAKGDALAAASMESKNEIKQIAAKFKLNEWVRQQAGEIFGEGVTMNDMSEEQAHQLLVAMHLHVLEMSDKLQAALDKAGVSKLSELPLATARQMLDQLRAKLGKS